ncbi:hypothetical protein DENSPDRAFT_887205 [Dentipellis sp. KUC8613]|nr:hypothetical protein DENSPDRAFT_887205 [Dentipellis sp. KUC8613]
MLHAAIFLPTPLSSTLPHHLRPKPPSARAAGPSAAPRCRLLAPLGRLRPAAPFSCPAAPSARPTHAVAICALRCALPYPLSRYPACIANASTLSPFYL